ncbi:MAG TPA: SNF2-related protein, partial [Candidatus Cybelea sp.]|nr:SNF2-related protein [Candidatus Cybelea sp.]
GIEEVEPPEILEHVLRDYQRRGLDFLTYLSSFRFGGILADDMGVGKAGATHQRVVTPTGLRRFGDLRVGDQVMGRDGLPHNVVGVYPQGVLPGYRVTFSDRSSTLCSDDHLWAVNSAVRKKRGLPYRVLTTRQVRERLYDAAGNARHYIPIADPMHFGQRPSLPIDPYLLGMLLGDGGMTQRHGLTFTTADAELFEACCELLPTGSELAPIHQYHYRIRRPRGARNHLLAALDEFGLTGCGSAMKFVPSMYKTAPLGDRLALLQGLLDTDGTTQPQNGNVEFTSTSDQLAQDVAFLVRSLGGVARMRYKAEPKYVHKGETRIGKPAYRVGISLPPEFPPFRLPRKMARYTPRTKYLPTRAITSVEYEQDVEMVCIAVDAPDKLFLLDDFIVTHNTVQVIAHIVKRKEMEGEVPVLVIAPTSVTHTWENEIKKFAPTLRTLRLQSGSDRAAKYETIFDYDVVVTSYALARLDAAQLERFRFRTLVLDEAQNTKNPGSQIAKVVRGLQADHRLALTGTPVENSLRDLWAIFGFVEPGLLGSEASFRRRFELPIADGDEGAAAALRSRLEPFLLRRTKEDVARELPERTEAVIECELTPLQRRLYRGIAEAARRDVLAKYDEEGAESATVHVLA